MASSRAGNPIPKSRLSPEFGPWLKRTRQGMRLTIPQLAEACGIGATALQTFELGHRLEVAVSVEMFMRLARGLQMEPGFVLYKAGFDLGKDGIDMARLGRVEQVVDAFAAAESDMRHAMVEAMAVFEDTPTPESGRIMRSLSRALMRLDLVTERMRREGFAAPPASFGQSRQMWSEAELDFVRRNPALSHAQMAAELPGRTADAVRWIRSELKKEEEQ